MSEDDRVLWIRTILAMAGTAPQRSAFIDGYNGAPLNPPASPKKLANHALGIKVSALLHGPRP